MTPRSNAASSGSANRAAAWWRKSGETKPTRRRRPSVRSSANGVSCARLRAWRASQFRVLGEDRLGREVVAVVQREQQVAVARGVVGPQRQGVAMTDLGLRVAPLYLQGDSEIGDPAMLCRCQPDRLTRRLLRRDGTPGAQIDRAQIAMGGGMRRIDGECRLQCLLCGVVAFHAEQGDAEIGLWFDPGRGVPGGVAECLGGVCQPAAPLQQRAKRIARLGVVGPRCQRGAIGGFSVVEAARVIQQIAKIVGRG